MPFTLYVALGDSMTTDHYPTCDVRNLDDLMNAHARRGHVNAQLKRSDDALVSLF